MLGPSTSVPRLRDSVLQCGRIGDVGRSVCFFARLGPGAEYVTSWGLAQAATVSRPRARPSHPAARTESQRNEQTTKQAMHVHAICSGRTCTDVFCSSEDAMQP
jgi:hypothetical protein